MALFNPALEYVLKNEGGLSDHPKDPGGITNFGISLRFLKSIEDPAKYGIHDLTIESDTIKDLKLEQASEIYRGEFWNHSNFSNISDQDVCNYVFDMAVNMGISPAIKCVQRAVWSVWRNRTVLKEDGIMGPQTLIWIERCTPKNLLVGMRSERAGNYREIIARRPDQEVFANGWLKRAYESEK